MSPSILLAYILVGCLVGALSGMLGIGGGVLIIPALTVLFHYTHREAVGTSLGMMLPPIGLLAFLTYYRAGDAKLSPAIILAVGFAIGGFLGAWLASSGRIPESLMQKLFALFLLYYAGSLLFRSDRPSWAAAKVVGLIGIFSASAVLMRLLGRRWEGVPAPAILYRQQLEEEFPREFDI